MGYLKFSAQEQSNIKLTLDNVFIAEYMPSAPENYVKVYLMGLSQALVNPNNSISTIAERLLVDQQIVDEAFSYWSEQGLVHIDQSGEQIEFLPVVSRSRQIRKFSKEKYKTFNEQLHAILPSRNILPPEYNEYYMVMETYNIEIEAMLTIIGYCKRLKGENISYPYIVTVARNLACEGYTTYDRVSEKLSELDLYNSDLMAILQALKLKRRPDHEDARLLVKWTKTYSFKLETIIYVAKNVKKGGVNYLDAVLSSYYAANVMSVDEIKNYTANRAKLFELTKQITTILGLHYDTLDYIIEQYTTKWLALGFSEDSLEAIARHCMKTNVRTIDGMNNALNKFYSRGLLTMTAIDEFISGVVKTDNEIQAVFDKANIKRNITSRDRDSYHTWVYAWQTPAALIDYAATLSVNASSQISYMNSILASWRDGKITTLEQAKAAASNFGAKASPPQPQNFITRDYSETELNAVYDRLTNEDF